MKRRYLVLLSVMFFMFLYIGPVNLLPSPIPPAIVQRPQEAKPTLEKLDNFVVSTDLDIVLAADSDDDWWGRVSGSWTHYTASTYMALMNSTVNNWYIAGQRFQLNIDKDSIISSANLTLYETFDPVARTSTIKRIDESNVGALEDDTELPSPANVTTASYSWDGVADEYGTANVTDLVQEQVNLADWVSGNYIGFQHMREEQLTTAQWKWEDYINAGGHKAYMNISYTAAEEEEESVSWLDSYAFRRAHVVNQTAGSGIDYPVSLDVYWGAGTTTGDTVYLNGAPRVSLQDIRFTNTSHDEVDLWLENYYYSQEQTDYFTDDAVETAWYYYNYPSSYYYNNRTYIAYGGEGYDPYIIYYDHENSTWSPTYRVGKTILPNDNHGVPTLWVDTSGFIHVLYGAHNYPYHIRHSKSDYANRLDSFSLVNILRDGDVTGCSYPVTAYDATNDVIHVLYREFPGGGVGKITYHNSTDGGTTWSDPHSIVDCSTVMAPYKSVGGVDNVNPEILHFTWASYIGIENPLYQDVRYAYLNTTTGIVYNVTGHSMGTAVNTTELDDVLIWDSSDAHVTGPNMKLPVDSSDPYFIFQVSNSPVSQTRTSMMLFWNSTTNSVSGPHNITTTTTNGGADMIINSVTDIDAFVTSGSDIKHYNWDGYSWSFVEDVYLSADADSQYLSWTEVPTGTKWTGSNNDTIQVIFAQYIPNSGKHIKTYAWGDSGIVKRNDTIGGKFWFKCPNNLSASNQTIYIYYGYDTAASASSQFTTYESPVPIHGSWNITESFTVTNISSYSQNSFAETVADEMRLYMDDDTSGYFAENFVDVTDWTGPETPTTDGDSGSFDVPGDSAWDSYTSNNVSLVAGTYYTVIRYKDNETPGASYFQVHAFAEDDGAGSSTVLVPSYYSTTSYLTYRKPIIVSHAIESVRISCIATGANTKFSFDYLRIDNQTGWEHDGSTTAKVTVGGGGSTSTDSDYISLIADGDGSTFDFLIDDTTDSETLSASVYPFLYIDFHSGDTADTITIQSYDGAAYATLKSSVSATDLRVNVRDVDTVVEYFRITVSASQTVRIDMIKSYGIANFSFSNYGNDLDSYLYVEGGALKSSEESGGWIELDLDVTISVSSLVYAYIYVNRTTHNTRSYSLECAVYVGEWQDWHTQRVFNRTGTTTDLKLRISNVGTLYAIKFGNTTYTEVEHPVAPVNYQAPTFDNPDDTDNMYARYKEYNITMYVSDANGYANIDFLKLGFWDDGRSNNYARWRYDSPENEFVEEYDWDDYFELNLTKSEATKTGDYINCTFVFTIDWSCPDLTDVHIAVTVRDNDALYDVDDHHFLTWDVETRLDFSTFSLDDGLGTPDRGDYDTLDGIVASGTIDYYGSTISPDSGDVDVWISCAEIAGSPWSDTTLTAGVFSVTVDSDDIVGLDTYDFKVVEEGAGFGGSDLSHTTHSDTYIADRLVINMQADDENPDNNVQVDFTLTVIYDYDDTVCTTYQIVISRDSIWWHSFTNANESLFVDIDSNVAHSYTMSNLTNETTHVLTKFISNTETVTWSAPVITTTPTTTETGIFYDLFLSLEMWGYLGPLGLVIVGYIVAQKNKGLGVIYYLVECLIAAQYFALIETTPAYWWHAIIIILGGLFGCVAPLMDKR